MKEECKGCYLIRIFLEDNITKYIPDQLTCEHQDLDCPCKICLVKPMCDLIENGMNCKYWVDFNTKYGSHEFWEERRKLVNISKKCIVRPVCTNACEQLKE